MTRIYSAGNVPESPLAQAPKGSPYDVQPAQAAAWVAAGWATLTLPADASPLALERLGLPLSGTITRRGVFDGDTTYSTGDLATETGAAYVCTNPPSAPGTPPSSDPDHWERIAGNVFRRGQWLADASYTENDLVTNAGATHVCAVPTAAPAIVADSFVRPDRAGWGVASGGADWLTLTGAAIPAIVADSGCLTTAGDQVQAQLLGGALGQIGTDLLVRWSMTRGSGMNDGAGPMFILCADGNWSDRRVSARRYLSGHWYTEIHTATGWHNEDAGAAIVPALQSGTVYWTRVRVQDSLISFRVWVDGDAEPTTWEHQIILEPNPVLGAGYTGLGGFLQAGDTLSFDSFSATALSPPPEHFQTVVPSPAQAGLAVLRGPYIVDYTDIPHDGDTLVLWTPAVGDVLLRLFCDWQTVVQWNHGYLYVGQNPNPDYVIGSGSVSQKNVIVEGDLSHIATSGSGPFDNIYDSLDSNSADASGAAWFSSAYIFHSTVPVMIQLTRTGGTDPTAGHLAIYALVARAVAP